MECAKRNLITPGAHGLLITRVSSLRGSRKMGGEGEEIPLFPVLPIPYPFRRLLRKLARFELLSPGGDSSYSYHLCFDHNI